MSARFEIRLALTDRDRRAIARLRQQGSNGVDAMPASLAEPVAGDPHDYGAHIFGAFEGPRAVAAIRLHILSETTGGPCCHALKLSVFGHYHPDRVGTVSGFVVASHIERDAELVATITRQFLCVAYLHRLEFLCGAFDVQWLSLMETLGWRRYLALSDCPQLHGAVPLCYVLSDAEHLRRVGSPFTPLAGAFGRNNFAASYFKQVQARHSASRKAMGARD